MVHLLIWALIILCSHFCPCVRLQQKLKLPCLNSSLEDFNSKTFRLVALLSLYQKEVMSRGSSGTWTTEQLKFVPSLSVSVGGVQVSSWRVPLRKLPHSQSLELCPCESVPITAFHLPSCLYKPSK